MAKADEAHLLTEKELAKLEKRIAKLYGDAAKEMQTTIDDYFSSFAKLDKEMQALVGSTVNGKEWTKENYKQWRLNQIGRGKRLEALRDKLAERVTQANETAVAYTNDTTPGIYSLNRNYTAYTIEQVSDAADFTLWDEQTVKRLAVERPDLMPYYPKKQALKRGIDLEYGKKQITASITSSILQGKSIKGIADDLQGRITTMSRASAIRTARTAVTGAQNAGRMDSYAAAEKMGIKLKKEWLATLDGRTRHSHAMLDGEQVAQDAKFSNGCRFPGDPQGPPWEVYNCRCTLIAAVDGVETSDAERWSRDPETGERKLVSDMSYREWGKGKSELSAELKNIVPQSSDVRDALDKITVRGTTPIKQGFSAFSKEDPLYKNIKNVLPDGNKFDVAMHGSPTSIAFGGRQANMSPRLLAQVIKHNPAYKGQDIRLIACNTGTKLDNSYCFAEELANALNVAVYAPNDLIFITQNGNIHIGEDRKGVFLEYTPNQRRRAK